MASRRITATVENAVGAVLLAIAGGLYSYRAIDYGVGTASDPGAGYFPALLGAVLAVLSLGVLARTIVGERRGEPETNGPWPVRPMVCVLAATTAFGVLLGGVPAFGFEGLGLVPTSAISVFIAGLASRSLPLGGNLPLSILLAATAWAVFIEGLGLIIPAWPWSY